MFISSIIFSYLFYWFIDLFFLPSGRQNKTSTVLNLFIQNRSAQFLYIIYFLILYPKKGMQDCLGFCIPCRGFRILGTGLQSLSVELKIPDTNCQWDSRFLEPYSRFQSAGFYISPLEIPGCLIPEFPGFWNLDTIMSIITWSEPLYSVDRHNFWISFISWYYQTNVVNLSKALIRVDGPFLGCWQRETWLSDFVRAMFLCFSRLRAVSLFTWSVEQNARDTQMATRVT